MPLSYVWEILCNTILKAGIWRLSCACFATSVKQFLNEEKKDEVFFCKPKQLLRIDEKSSSASVPQHHCAHCFCWKRGRTALPGSGAEDAVCSLAASNTSTQLTVPSTGIFCCTSKHYRHPSVFHYQGLSPFGISWLIKKSKMTDF